MRKWSIEAQVHHIAAHGHHLGLCTGHPLQVKWHTLGGMEPDLRILVLRAFVGRFPRAAFMLRQPVHVLPPPTSPPAPTRLTYPTWPSCPTSSSCPTRPSVCPSVHPSYPSPPTTEPELRHSSLFMPLDNYGASEQVGERLLHC